MSTPGNNVSDEIQVWDPLVRIFHWTLVVTFTLAYLTGDDESFWHEWFGYAVLALVGVRLIWGFVGTRHARFSDFVYPPRMVLGYAIELMRGRARRYIGHNPLGDAMIVLLLTCLSTTSITGWFLLEYDPNTRDTTLSASTQTISVISDAFADGEASEKDDGEGTLEEVHEFFANFTLLLIVLHIAGVALSSIAHRENLAHAMITGNKRP